LSKIFTYQKKDKLKSRKQTQFLFSNGKSITSPPIKLLYTIEHDEAKNFVHGLLQAGVGAPSRYFRKAVQRNKVKRLLREGYRLEKPNFMNSLSLTNVRLNLFFLYIDVNVQSQQQIQGTIKILLEKLAVKLKSNAL
jgi:ribonuclease P protein component